MVSYALQKIALPLSPLLLLFIFAGQASGVLITGLDAHTIPDGLPLENVGKLGGDTGIYLDNGWVLTAGHLDAGDIIFGGETYYYDELNNVRVKNPDGYEGLDSTYTDLRLFRLTEVPDLPALSIPDISPGIDEALYYAGYGIKASETLSYWTYSRRQGWSEVDGPTPYWGYHLIGPKELNWGRNRVLPSGSGGGPTENTFYVELDNGTSEIALATMLASLQGDAGAVDGDTGGAAFYYDDNGAGSWMLAGVISCVRPPQSDPPSLGMAGSCTFSVALSFYHDQIFDIIDNPILPEKEIIFGDANGDGRVDTDDSTILIAHWHQAITGTGEERRAFGDFNADGLVDEMDTVLLVSNWLYDTNSGMNLLVPEPSVWILLLGLFCIKPVLRRSF